MLIYERRVKEKMKIVIPKDVMQALGCDGTAMTSAVVQKEDNHLFHVFPKLKDQILQNKDLVAYDSDKDEHTVMVNFDDARKFVPNAIYKKVHKDNLKFLCEKQVFVDQFYKSTLELLQLCICNSEDISNDQGRFELLFKLIDRLIFDLLVNSAANLALKGTNDLLLVLLSKSDAAVQYIVKHRVFAPKESLGKDEKDFFEMLCSH
jgi:hypothetical protein